MEKSKFIETRLRKFVGQYDSIPDNMIEAFREYFLKGENRNIRNQLLERLEEMANCECVTPFEILSLASDIGLKIDVHALCTLLCRKSLSISKITGKVIRDYLIPSLKYKISRESTMIKISDLSKRSDYDKYSIEVPFEEMGKEQQETRRNQFLINLADFLYATKTTIQAIMHPKIFDKVIDGIEFRFIKHKHFIRLVKRAGFSLSYNDEM